MRTTGKSTESTEYARDGADVCLPSWPWPGQLQMVVLPSAMC